MHTPPLPSLLVAAMTVCAELPYPGWRPECAPNVPRIQHFEDALWSITEALGVHHVVEHVAELASADVQAMSFSDRHLVERLEHLPLSPDVAAAVDRVQTAALQTVAQGLVVAVSAAWSVSDQLRQAIEHALWERLAPRFDASFCAELEERRRFDDRLDTLAVAFAACLPAAPWRELQAEMALRELLDPESEPLTDVCVRDCNLEDGPALHRYVAGLREAAGRFLDELDCFHQGAAGPCMPRGADGRCVWCERPLSAVTARGELADHTTGAHP